MRHRYVAPSDSSAETLAVIDQMNALLDAADEEEAGEAKTLRRRADAMGKRLRARMASNAVQR
jgi:ElaB/YqjD/DUF883 family membrane-anchored ribosome-binding protein